MPFACLQNVFVYLFIFGSVCVMLLKIKSNLCVYRESMQVQDLWLCGGQVDCFVVASGIDIV